MLYRLVFILFGLAVLLTQRPAAALAVNEPAQPLAAARQLVLVIAADWDSNAGLMRCYERATADGAWVRVGSDVPVSLGRSGLGWGRGVHAAQLIAGPMKREGDGKAPAGVFLFGEAFTSAPSELGNMDLPTLTTSATLFCVDDVNSRFYNTLQDTSSVSPDWNSSESMLREDGLYRHGLIVRHNSDPVEPGAGSCIFFHIWKELQHF